MKDRLIAADTNPLVHMGLIALTAAVVIAVHHSHVTMQQFWNANLITTVWNLMIFAVADLALHRREKSNDVEDGARNDIFDWQSYRLDV